MGTWYCLFFLYTSSLQEVELYRLLTLTLLLSLACGDTTGDTAKDTDPTTAECVTTWAVPFCDDSSLPQAGDGCFEECADGTCSAGTCTEAWLGCGPDADCDVCGTSGWICLE
jgi:hypothetical protein